MAIQVIRNYGKFIKHNDVINSRSNFQWFSKVTESRTKEQLLKEGKIFFLFRVFGTGIQIVQGSENMFTAVVDQPNFEEAPLRLSDDGWSITGSIDGMYGFYTTVGTPKV